MAETYLRKARGITCPLPPALGFLPRYKPEHSPALIAAFGLPDEVEPGVLAPPRNVTAVHLTLLKPDGSGKADVPKPKLMIGSPGALPIVLAPVNDLCGLAITEGSRSARRTRDIGIVTLSVQAKNVRIVHETSRSGEYSPSHRVMSTASEIGAG